MESHQSESRRDPPKERSRKAYRMSLQVDKPTQNANLLFLSASAKAPVVSTSYQELMQSLEPAKEPFAPRIERSANRDLIRSRHLSLKPQVEIPLERIDNNLNTSGPLGSAGRDGSQVKIIRTLSADTSETIAEWGRQTDERRYTQSLAHATSLLNQLEHINESTPVRFSRSSRKGSKGRSVIDISNRCIGLSTPDSPRKLPGDIKLSWRQGVIVQISPNGNMTLFYTITNQKGKLEKYVRHYYLTHNGIINAAIDLNLCLSGQDPGRKVV
jgi:hypothetical protein